MFSIKYYFFILYLQFILPHPSDGIYFDIYEFTLNPNTHRVLSVTWQPILSGNIRKLIKLKQVDSNTKYEFIILGNCIAPVKNNVKVLC